MLPIKNCSSQTNINSSVSFIHWSYQSPPSFHPYWFEIVDYDEWKRYASTNWTYSFYTSILYLTVIFSLKHFMRYRQPLRLQWTLITWNLSLAIFSLMGFIRTGQELLYVLGMPDGLHKSICSRVGLNRPAAFYSVAFALSKYVELGDTLFITLRKQPLIFLQWYHHIASLILAWKVMPFSEPIFRYYGVMNYFIHFVMYFYFALKVMNYRVPRKLSVFITTLQLLQMMIGVAINVYSVHIIAIHGKDACARDPESVKWIGGVYVSFVFLFAHFFYERYLSKKRKME